MLWESNLKKENWSISERSDPSNTSYLIHYGVPGMHWGEITKEYVKKGYNTVQRTQAIKKTQRKNLVRKQFNEGYHRGSMVATNTRLISDRIKRKQAEMKKNSPDFIDRKIQKIADQYGLGEYGKVASEKLKEFVKEQGLNFGKSASGQKIIQNVANVGGKGLSVVLGKTAPIVGKGAEKLAYAIDHAPIYIAKGTIRGGKFLARMPAYITKASYNFVKNGGMEKIRIGTKKAYNASKVIANTMSKYGKITMKAIEQFDKNVNQIARINKKGAKTVSKAAQSGGRVASKAMSTVLKRVVRRRVST